MGYVTANEDIFCSVGEERKVKRDLANMVAGTTSRAKLAWKREGAPMSGAPIRDPILKRNSDRITGDQLPL